MPEDIVFYPTDRGTLRPHARPLRKKGDAFELMKLPDFGWDIILLLEHVSPDDLTTLFTIHYTLEIMDLIAQKMNDYVRILKDDSCPYVQANEWYPIRREEIYVYFALSIYMILYICNKIFDYWNTRDFRLVYLILIEMLRNCF